MNRILFMIVDNQLKIIQDNNIDHREWYTSLGFDPNNFENIVRGYVLDNKIIFFKGGAFNYDQDVIIKAKMFSPSIRRSLNNEALEVYCGLMLNGSSKWEPILKISNAEIDSYVPPKPKEEPKVFKEQESSIEFKNNYEDPKFIRLATIVTSIVIVLIIIIKIILFKEQKILQITNPLDILLSIIQVGLLIFSIYGYITKKSFAKYISLIASVLIVLTLDIFDIIIGVLYFLFSIDQTYFIKFINLFKKGDKNV